MGTYWTPDQTRIKAFAQEEADFLDYTHNDQIIFIIEHQAYQADPLRSEGIGVTRGDPNILTIESTHIGSLVHEFGHSFGDLGDEYPKRVAAWWVSTYANIATDHPGDQCADHWDDLTGMVIRTPGTWVEARSLRTVGCYESQHEESEGITHTPTDSACVMDQINDGFPFCPVCRRHLVGLLDRYEPAETCAGTPGVYRDRAAFEAATGALAQIDFDRMTDDTAISAPSPGVALAEQFAALGVHFTAGVIFGEPDLPFGGVSAPNVVSNSGVNLPERALVAGYFDEPVCALGITNTGAQATLRAYDMGFRLIESVTSDDDSGSNDFIGIVASRPIHRLEFDFYAGIGFEGDDLLFSH